VGVGEKGELGGEGGLVYLMLLNDANAVIVLV